MALSTGGTFADLFIEEDYQSKISFLDSRVDKVSSGWDYGVGIRVLHGTKMVYGYTNDLSRDGLLQAARTIAQAYSGGSELPTGGVHLVPMSLEPLKEVLVAPEKVKKSEKVPWLVKVDDAARGVSPLISQVDITLVEKTRKIWIANSEGLLKDEERCYTRVSVNAIATKDGEKQSNHKAPGAMQGYEFIQELDPVALGRETAEVAVLMVEADYAPAGKMPVIIDSDFGGVIFHEACGHALETTSVAKKASVFAGKLGEEIAGPVVTAIDDGTLPGLWGSSAMDDEGTPTERTVLIEKGILRSYMVDRLGGLKTGYKSTGSGRRESYRYPPTSRMRNTFIDRGESDLESMIASIDYGLYAKKMGGGSVSPGTGEFNFAVTEGYLIEGGKVTRPARGASLIGRGADILKKIVMVGKNLEHTPGTCGSVSGGVPTTVGQPAIKVSEIVVGGRKTG
jgi:TldD protein